MAPLRAAGLPQQRAAVHAHRVGRAQRGCRACHHPQLDLADLHLPAGPGRGRCGEADAAPALRRGGGPRGHLHDRRRRGAARARAFAARPTGTGGGSRLLRLRGHVRPRVQGTRSDGARRRLAALRRGDAAAREPRDRPAVDARAIGRVDDCRAGARGALHGPRLHDLLPAHQDLGADVDRRAGLPARAHRRDDRRGVPGRSALAHRVGRARVHRGGRGRDDGASTRRHPGAAAAAPLNRC